MDFQYVNRGKKKTTKKQKHKQKTTINIFTFIQVAYMHHSNILVFNLFKHFFCFLLLVHICKHMLIFYSIYTHIFIFFSFHSGVLNVITSSLDMNNGLFLICSINHIHIWKPFHSKFILFVGYCMAIFFYVVSLFHILFKSNYVWHSLL